MIISIAFKDINGKSSSILKLVEDDFFEISHDERADFCENAVGTLGKWKQINKIESLQDLIDFYHF